MIGQHIEYCIGQVKDAFDNQVEGAKASTVFLATLIAPFRHSQISKDTLL